jgi:hypothetical protein
VGPLAEFSTLVQSHIMTGFRGGQRELRCHSSGVPDGDPCSVKAHLGLQPVFEGGL